MNDDLIRAANLLDVGEYCPCAACTDAKALAARLRALAAGMGEPFGWVEPDSELPIFHVGPTCPDDGWTPLYTAPQAAAPRAEAMAAGYEDLRNEFTRWHLSQYPEEEVTFDHAWSAFHFGRTSAPPADQGRDALDAARYRLIRSECWVSVPDDECKLTAEALDKWADKEIAEYTALSAAPIPPSTGE